MPETPKAGRLAGPVRVALWAAWAVAAASLLYGTFPHLAVFVVAEALFAVAITLISGADEALAYDSLLAQGRPAGLLVFDPTTRLLVIAVGDGPATLLPRSMFSPK